MEPSRNKLPELKDLLRALIQDVLEEAQRAGVPEPWHVIREVEGRVWEMRNQIVEKAG